MNGEYLISKQVMLLSPTLRIFATSQVDSDSSLPGTMFHLTTKDGFEEDFCRVRGGFVLTIVYTVVAI